MSKRKVQFSDNLDDALEQAFEGGESASKVSKDSRFKEKHSLDSDEEDNVDKYDILAEDDIEGQEDGDVNYEEGMRFTPFNMKEELEDGHFDTDGTYIFKKEKEIKDSWLDNIDWVKIKEKSEINPSSRVAEDSSDDDDDEKEKIDLTSIYNQMIELMKPGESVTKALKRLGGNQSNMSASQRWKKKKKDETIDPEKAKEEKEGKEKMLKLTELTDRVFQQGDVDVYQDTYEKIQFKIKVAGEKEVKSKTVVPEGVDEDDALDMFADKLDQKGDGDKKEPQPGSSVDKKKENGDEKEKAKGKGLPSEIKWEFKWTDEDSKLHGPFSSDQMAEWQEDGYFKDDCLVRKVGTESFYSCRRIDFELYT